MGMILDVQEKLERTINYMNSLKLYCDKIKYAESNEDELEDNIKFMVISIENLKYIFEKLVQINNSYSSASRDFYSLVKQLGNSFIISEKCVEKVIYINKCYKRIVNNTDTCDQELYIELPIITEYLDDILDELLDYLSNNKMY